MKKLPFKEPYIRCYNHHAFPTGIIACAQKDKNMIYNSFLQLEFNPNYRRKIDFVFNYFFEDERAFVKGYYLIPKHDCRKEVLLPIIISLIESNSYIIGIFDEYYIKCKMSYKKWNYNHNYIIYGYNEEKELLYSVGYIGEDMIWDYFTITYDEYISSLVYENDYLCFNNFIPSQNYYGDINCEKIFKGINSYLKSENEVINDNSIYGLKGVNAYFEYMKEKLSGEEQIHMPSIYAILEHKRLMLERMDYLSKCKVLKLEHKTKADLLDIVDKYTIILNLSLKYNITYKKSLLISIYDLASNALQLEEKTLKKCVQKF